MLHALCHDFMPYAPCPMLYALVICGLDLKISLHFAIHTINMPQIKTNLYQDPIKRNLHGQDIPPKYPGSNHSFKN